VKGYYFCDKLDKNHIEEKPNVVYVKAEISDDLKKLKLDMSLNMSLDIFNTDKIDSCSISHEKYFIDCANCEGEIFDADYKNPEIFDADYKNPGRILGNDLELVVWNKIVANHDFLCKKGPSWVEEEYLKNSEFLKEIWTHARDKKEKGDKFLIRMQNKFPKLFPESFQKEEDTKRIVKSDAENKSKINEKSFKEIFAETSQKEDDSEKN